MNILHTIAIRDLKQNRKRSVATFIAVIATVMIITFVLVGYGSILYSDEFEERRGSNFHISFYQLTAAEIEEIVSDEAVKTYFVTEETGFAKLPEDSVPYYYRPYVCVTAMTEDAMEYDLIEMEEGRYPQNDSEIIIPSDLTLYGENIFSTGDNVSFELGVRVLWHDGRLYILDNTYRYIDEYEYDKKTDTDELVREEFVPGDTKEYTIVGTYRPIDNHSDYDKYLVDLYSAGYLFLTNWDGQMQSEHRYNLYVTYTNAALKDYVRTTGRLVGYENFTWENEDEELANAAKKGLVKYYFGLHQSLAASDADYLTDLSDTTVSAIENLLLNWAPAIVMAGYFMLFASFCISSCFEVSMHDKIKLYGLYRSVGATDRQIRKSVRFEILILGILAIPVGLALGLLLAYAVISAMDGTGSDLFEVGYYRFNVSPRVILCVILVSLFTLFLSSGEACRSALKIGPHEATVGYLGDNTKVKKLKCPKWISELFGIGGELAYKNVRRNSGKYLAIRIAFLVCTVAVIAVSYLGQFSELLVGEEYPSDAWNLDVVVNVDYDEYGGMNNFRANFDVDDFDAFLEIAESTEKYNPDGINIIRCSAAWRNSPINLNYTDVYYDRVIRQKEIDGEDAEYEPRVCAVDADTYRTYVESLGLDYEDAKDKIILFNYAYLLNRFFMYEKTPILDANVGDELIFSDRDGNEKARLEICAITGGDDIPDFADHVDIIMSIDYMRELVEAKAFDIVSVTENLMATEDPDAVERLIRDNMGDSVDTINVDNLMEEYNRHVLVMKLVVYAFVAAIAILGLSNVFNNVTVSMEQRAPEFASMKSIGMTNKEFRKMIFLESAFITLKSVIIGTIIGSLFTVGIWFFMVYLSVLTKYVYPWQAVLIILAAAFAIVYLIMLYMLSRINKRNIIDTVRQSNV